MLQVDNLTKSFGARLLFEDVTFTMSKGERLGLVGRNGCGKSTLFKIILGEETADSGEVRLPKGYRIGHLSQHIKFSKPTLLEECVQVLPEEIAYEHYRAEKILFGLGFTQSDLDRPPSEFSGGYQLRINLTKCLLQEPDLLLLDEPTNYLDVVSMRWMEKFLTNFPGELLLITHDRRFMDLVVTDTMGINRQSLRKFSGSTEKYYEQVAMDDAIHEKTRVNQEKKLQQMHKFVERFRAKASKATQAQSVLRRMEKMDVLSQLDSEQILGFRFNYAETPAKRMMVVKDLSFGFEEGDPLFEKISFVLKPEDRIAVIGPNGRGKTTLLNVLDGQLEAWSGEVEAHPTTKIGYYQQTNKKALTLENSVAQEIALANTKLETSQSRAICGAMMFSGSDADKKIKVLSGGEQGRVLLGKVLAHSSNVLFLDEPTNHLDMESIQVMTEEIDQFPGGVIFVSHDEEMLERLANRLIVFQGGKAEVFEGTYEEFLEKVGWEDDQTSKKKKKKYDKKELKRLRAELVQESSKVLRPLEKRVKELEDSIVTLEDNMKEIGDGDGDPEKYKEIGKMQIQLEENFSELEDVSSRLERKKSEFEKRREDLQ